MLRAALANLIAWRTSERDAVVCVWITPLVVDEWSWSCADVFNTYSSFTVSKKPPIISSDRLILRRQHGCSANRHLPVNFLDQSSQQKPHRSPSCVAHEATATHQCSTAYSHVRFLIQHIPSSRLPGAGVARSGAAAASTAHTHAVGLPLPYPRGPPVRLD